MASKDNSSKTKTPKETVVDMPVTAPKQSKNLLGLLLCFILSVGASLGGAFVLMPKPNFSAEATKIEEQGKKVEAMQKMVAEQNQTIQAIKAENEVLKLYLRHSSATAVKNILINQEENIQAYLKVMKASMDDLSKLVPGAMNWNDKYQYQLDLALKGSLERADLLRMLKTGEPNDKTSNTGTNPATPAQ